MTRERRHQLRRVLVIDRHDERGASKKDAEDRLRKPDFRRCGGTRSPASADVAANEIQAKLTAKSAVISPSRTVMPPAETTSIIS